MELANQDRGVVVAIALSSAGPKRLKWLYRGLESVARQRAGAVLSTSYKHCLVIPGAPTSSRVINAVEAVATQVAVVDLVLVVHGLPHKLVFADHEEVWADSFAKRLAGGPAQGKLRLMYSTACFGATHADDMVAHAFETAIGSKGQNANGASEFEALLRAWASGASVAEAVEIGDRRVQRLAWDLIARGIGRFRSVDSEKIIVGSKSLRISDPRRAMSPAGADVISAGGPAAIDDDALAGDERSSGR